MVKLGTCALLCALLAVGCGSSDDGSGGGGTSSGGQAGSGGAGAKGGAGVGGSSTGGSGSAGGPSASFGQACVDRINEFRASEGLTPYQRWTEQESCANGQAQSDSETKKPHGAFGDCTENAQNECPGYGSEASVLGTCLDQMWAEGPGSDFQKHGHYINMSSTKYTKVACGLFVTSNGSVWSVQDFR